MIRVHRSAIRADLPPSLAVVASGRASEAEAMGWVGRSEQRDIKPITAFHRRVVEMDSPKRVTPSQGRATAAFEHLDLLEDIVQRNRQGGGPGFPGSRRPYLIRLARSRQASLQL